MLCCVGYSTFSLCIHYLTTSWAVSTLLAMMKNPAVNIHVRGFMWTNVFISLGYISRSGISGSFMLKKIHLSKC